MFFYRRESAFRSHESKPLTPLTETAFSRGSRPSDKEGGGGGGVIQTPTKGGGGGGSSKKFFFQPFGPQFGLKIMGGRVPRAPSLDSPLALF